MLTPTLILKTFLYLIGARVTTNTVVLIKNNDYDLASLKKKKLLSTGNSKLEYKKYRVSIKKKSKPQTILRDLTDILGRLSAIPPLALIRIRGLIWIYKDEIVTGY